jgi:hypothetical protein
LGPSLKTPVVGFAGSFGEKSLEGRFRKTPWPFNIRNYQILPHSRLN